MPDPSLPPSSPPAAGAPAPREACPITPAADRWLTLLGGLLLAFLALTHWARFAAVKPLWLDELLTYYAVWNHSWGSFWESITSGVNYQPPPWFALTWVATRWGGATPELLRLCSAAFFAVALVFLPLALARLGGPRAALLAVAAVFLTNPLFPLLLLEARPYGPYFLVAALAFLSTLRLAREPAPGRSAWLTHALLQALLPSVQYVGGMFGAVSLAVVVADDAARRRWRPRLYASWLAGWAVFGLTIFPLFLVQVLRDPFGDWLQRLDAAGLARFYATYLPVPGPYLLGLGMLAVLAALGWVFSRWGNGSGGGGGAVPPGPPVERRAVWLAVAWLALPALLALASRVGFFNLLMPRYFLPSLVALMALLTIVWHRVERWVFRLWPAGCGGAGGPPCWRWVLVPLLCGAMAAPFLARDQYPRQGNRPGILPELGPVRGPVVTGSALLFLENQYHQPEGKRYVLLARDTFRRDTFRRFAPSLDFRTAAELDALGGFLYLRTPQDEPTFAIDRWAAAEGRPVLARQPLHELVEAVLVGPPSPAAGP